MWPVLKPPCPCSIKSSSRSDIRIGYEQTGGTASPPIRLKMAGTSTGAPAGPSATGGVLQLVPEGAPLLRDESVAQEQLLFQTPEAQRLLDTGPSTVAEAGSCASSEVCLSPDPYPFQSGFTLPLLGTGRPMCVVLRRS